MLSVTMPGFAHLPLLVRCGLMGHAAGSDCEVWTTISTSSFPAMGKDELAFVLQVPPEAGLESTFWGQITAYPGWFEIKASGQGRSHLQDMWPAIWVADQKSGLRRFQKEQCSRGAP